jgi:hypothetical protein
MHGLRAQEYRVVSACYQVAGQMMYALLLLLLLLLAGSSATGTRWSGGYVDVHRHRREVQHTGEHVRCLHKVICYTSFWQFMLALASDMQTNYDRRTASALLLLPLCMPAAPAGDGFSACHSCC